MGLKGDKQPALKQTRGRNGGGDLGWVVTVIVHHEHALGLPTYREAAVHAVKCSQSAGVDGKWDTKKVCDGERP